MWYLALRRDGQLKRRAVHGCKWNLKACSEHGSVSMGEGGAGGVEGGVRTAWRAAWGPCGGRAEEIGEGGGVGDGMGAHRDRAESAVRDQQLRARTGASAAAAAR
jgi:hypothetical protein